MQMKSTLDLSNVVKALADGRLIEDLKLENHWRIECHDADGNLKWVDEFDNLITTAGKTDIVSKYFSGSAYTAAFYVGLTSATPTVAAADTMASHSGWTEVTAYSQATRPAFTIGSVTSGSASNSGSAAAFTVNANSTSFGGLFLCTDNTKGGTAGTLYGVGAMTNGDKTLSNTDSFTATITVSAT